MEASGRLRDLACSRPRAGPFKPGVSAVSLEEECERAGFKSLACVQPKLRRGHIAHDSYRYSLLTPAQKLSGTCQMYRIDPRSGRIHPAHALWRPARRRRGARPQIDSHVPEVFEAFHRDTVDVVLM